MNKAIEDVLAERKRQVEEEGWSPSHDDEHDEGEMADAAAAYALAERFPKRIVLGAIFPGSWVQSWFKPTTYRRNLVKAAALLIAEIERLDRKEAYKTAVISDDDLIELLGAEDEDVDYYLSKERIQVCAGEWVRRAKNEWVFEENEDE